MLLQSSISFKDLDPEQLRIVVDAMLLKKVPKGENIITQGEPAPASISIFVGRLSSPCFDWT